jgi:nitric oxide reductase large subunit
MATQVSTKRILIWIAVGFVIVSIWQHPQTTSQEMGNFLGDVGHFFVVVIDKVAEFLSGLSGAGSG